MIFQKPAGLPELMKLRYVALRLLGAIALLLGFATSAIAEIGPWQDLGGGRARLIVVQNPTGEMVSGVVEVELKPKWTTYWRSPGESGIPPQFDFSGSQNLIVSQPEFPAPIVKKTDGSVSYVYQNRVLFPFSAQVGLGKRGTKIKLELLIGVCEIICIPATAEFEHKFASVSVSDFKALRIVEEAQSGLPKATSTSDPVRIDGVRVLDDNILLVDALLGTNANDPMLLVEGRPEWYLRPGKLKSTSAGVSAFHVDLSVLPENASISGETLRFTLVTDSASIQQEFSIK